jgi:hypothetical protein
MISVSQNTEVIMVVFPTNLLSQLKVWIFRPALRGMYLLDESAIIHADAAGSFLQFDQKTPGFAFLSRLLVGFTETQFPRRNTSARVQDFTPIDNSWIDIDESIMVAVVASALNRAQIIANI